MDDVIAHIPAVVTFPDQAAFQTIFNGGNVWLCGGLFFFFITQTSFGSSKFVCELTCFREAAHENKIRKE